MKAAGLLADPPPAAGLRFSGSQPVCLLSVRANLEFGLEHIPAAERQVELGTALELLGIGHLLARGTATLSSGERQRVAIARALLTESTSIVDGRAAGGARRATQTGNPALSRTPPVNWPFRCFTSSHAMDESCGWPTIWCCWIKGACWPADPAPSCWPGSTCRWRWTRKQRCASTATVAAHDEAYQLTRLDFPGGSIR